MIAERIFIAVGPNCWGKADTRKKAVTAMKRKWPSFIPESGAFAVYNCPTESRVTESGLIAYPESDPKPPILVSRGSANQRKIP